MKNIKLFSVKCASLVLVACMLAGCGGKKTESITDEDITKVPEEPYQINWYTRAPVQSDVESVETMINGYLKDKLNVTLKLNILDSAQYKKKMQTMVAAGEKFDLAYCGSGMFDYPDSVRTGAFYDMSEYLDTYMPDIKEQMDTDFLKTAYVDGKLGGIPCLKEYSAEWGWIYRTDIAEKYGIDMSKMKTLEDLEPYLLEIKANEPGIEYPIEWDTTMSPVSTLTFTAVGADCVIFLDDGVPREKVEILSESEEFQNLCKVTRRFYEEGLVKPDALTANDAMTRFKSGQAFVTIFSLKPDAYKEKFADIQYPIAQVSYTANLMNKANAAMIGLSSTSENPVRAMRFLNLLYSDPVLSNMIVYGVEGKHYNLNADGRVEQIENSGYSLYPYQYMLGNIFLNKLRADESEDKLDKLREFNKTAVPNIANGFWPDTTSYELEKIQADSVVGEYRTQMAYGMMDPDEIYEKYSKKLKEAGIDKIHKEVSRQYEEYIKNNK